MLSDIFPTGYEAGVLKGQIKLGDTVAIIGAGPIGLATLLTAQFCSPSQIIVVDIDDYRLQMAKKLGATMTINDCDNQAVKKIMQHTNQKGVNVSIEAVGTPKAFDTCQLILAPGGFLANIGVHGKSVNLHLENLWHENITLTTALVDTFTIPTLLKIVESGKLHPEQLITHHFSLSEAMKAYDVFENASKQQALKGNSTALENLFAVLIFSNLLLSLFPVLIRLTVFAAPLLVEFVGAFGNLRRQIGGGFRCDWIENPIGKPFHLVIDKQPCNRIAPNKTCPFPAERCHKEPINCNESRYHLRAEHRHP